MDPRSSPVKVTYKRLKAEDNLTRIVFERILLFLEFLCTLRVSNELGVYLIFKSLIFGVLLILDSFKT